MKITVSSKGRIVIPAELRAQDRIVPGEEFIVERISRGEYRLLLRSTSATNEGVVDWLLSCPVKGFFVTIESANASGRRERAE